MLGFERAKSRSSTQGEVAFRRARPGFLTLKITAQTRVPCANSGELKLAGQGLHKTCDMS